LIQSETLELLEWSRLCQHLATFAATKLGALAARHLRIPETVEESLALLTQTEEVYQLENTLVVSLSFDGVQDIGDALERAEHQGILLGDELLAIATTLAGVRQLRRTIDHYPDLTVLNQLVSELRTYPELEQEIHRCIDERGKVMDRASLKLAEVREQLRQQRDRIYDKLQRIIQRQANALQEPLITQRGDRFVLPVKAPQKDAIPGIVHDTSTSGATLYVEPHSIVEMGNRLRQLLRQEQVEEEAVRRSLTTQVAEVKPDLERLLAIATTLDLATARARYSLWLGANSPRFIEVAGVRGQGSGVRGQEVGIRDRREDRGNTEDRGDEGDREGSSSSIHQPINSSSHPPVVPSEPIVLRQLRHPLLVWQQQHEQGMAVVPIDLVIQPHIRVVAITGPNTGGKTVTLKTLGLAALMAKVGLFVPAKAPVELPWFDQVLADIGDEQSLQQSLSTFSGHIRRISRILDALRGEKWVESEKSWGDEEGRGGQEGEGDGASEQQSSGDEEATASNQPLTASCQLLKTNVKPRTSLVLLDEVGAGTDPLEGSALAIALLKYLADHAMLTIATTHFGELKALKYQDERFENASVEFDDVTLSPTYRLLWGIPGRSNALSIARRLGLSDDIVDQAQNHVGMADSEEVNQVIAGLEAQRRQQEEKAKTAAKLVQQAEKLHEEVSRKAELLKQREQDLKQQQEQAVQAAIAQAKADIAKVIRQLQQGPVTAQEAQQATDAINQIAAQMLPSRQQSAKPKPGFRPQVGDRVRITRLGQTAEVLTHPDEDGEMTVRFGLMKMTVSLADVESLQGEKAEVPKAKSTEAQRSRGAGEQGSRGAGEPTPVVATAPAIRTSRNTIDIRGSRVADAEVVVERAIATAQPGPLWIIHGHGTGKLKRGVHEFLKQHPQVSRFEAAEQADGGTGVTVAYIE
jgi:DNA mismatch repair protein MutS2